MNYKNIVIVSLDDFRYKNNSECNMIEIFMSIIDTDIFNNLISELQGVSQDSYEMMYSKFIDKMKTINIFPYIEIKNLFIEFCDNSEIFYQIIKDIVIYEE